MWEAIHGDYRPIELDSFESVIDILRDRCPELTLRLHTSVARAIIPRQPGLDFAIHLALANRDELHMRVGGLLCTWVACGDDDVVRQFTDTVVGLIAGDYRVVRATLFGRVISGRIQKPAGRWWTTVARQDPEHVWVLRLCRSRVLVNTAPQRDKLIRRTTRPRGTLPRRTELKNGRNPDIRAHASR